MRPPVDVDCRNVVSPTVASSASVLPNTVHGRTHSVLDAIARTEEEAFIIAHTLAGYFPSPSNVAGQECAFRESARRAHERSLGMRSERGPPGARRRGCDREAMGLGEAR